MFKSWKNKYGAYAIIHVYMRKPLKEQKDYFPQKSVLWLLPMKKEVGTQDVGNTDNVLSLMLDSLDTMLCFICISIVYLHYMQI